MNVLIASLLILSSLVTCEFPSLSIHFIAFHLMCYILVNQGLICEVSNTNVNKSSIFVDCPNSTCYISTMVI